jgi:hypothetical protein
MRADGRASSKFQSIRQILPNRKRVGMTGWRSIRISTLHGSHHVRMLRIPRAQGKPLRMIAWNSLGTLGRKSGGYGTSGFMLVFPDSAAGADAGAHMWRQIMLLNSPIIPLFLRSIIWTLSLVALSLAGSIFHLSRKYHVEQKASTIMAIVVDAIALVYTIYITYDEYSGKPLGLRSPTVKMRLSRTSRRIDLCCG